jgi:predicted nucleotidyltransferase
LSAWLLTQVEPISQPLTSVPAALRVLMHKKTVYNGAMAAKTRRRTATGLYYRYLPPNIPMSAIRRFARRIAEKFDPEKIILFGSFAYGTPHRDSDVDLLVVMPAHDEINQSIRIILAFDPVFPLDLIVRTPQRLRRRLAEADSFLHEITSKGIVLHEKSDARVGAKGGGRLAGRQSLGGLS